MKRLLQAVSRWIFPSEEKRLAVARALHRWRRPAWLSALHPLRPFSRDYGYSRGRVIDRHYIDRFLEREAASIRGHVLEVAGDRYIRTFGGDAVTRADVLHVEAGHPGTTIVADLSNAHNIADDTFDCLILTQTVQCIYEIRRAVEEIHRILKPGGTALVTSHGIGKLSRDDMERWGEYWRLTSRSASNLFSEVFGEGNVQVRAHGNCMAAVAFLQGLSVEDVRESDLDYFDPDYEIIVTVRATKC